MTTEKLTIEVTENELATLQFFAKYDATTIEQIAKEAIQEKLEWYVRAVGNDLPDAIFKKWLDGKGSEVEA